MKKKNLFLRKYISPDINIYKVATSSLLDGSIKTVTFPSGEEEGTETLGSEIDFVWN